jgi:type I restriction enzyme R subunit
LNKERLKFILRYAIAFVNKKEKQKHIMRYPQMFATFAIEKHLNTGKKRGIIWHTQGSGKTALSFYNVRFLNDYFAKNAKVAKFYFIVDRLDLLKQAQKEFIARGLRVKSIQNKEEFKKEMSQNTAISNDGGELEITVVNIQKFDNLEIPKPDYDINIQRVYFIDEAHRSYNPKGSFLANLYSLDKNAVFIALTGTPLLKKEYKSTDIFGEYIHKYYYNLSIKDGYTLRLIREEIESHYKAKLKEILESLEIAKGAIKAQNVTSHKNFVKPMLEYILDDLEKFRKLHGRKVGGMVVCDSSVQARAIYEEFLKKTGDSGFLMAAEPRLNRDKYKIKTAALILHDEDTKSIREDKIQDFKDGKVDILFVYNMLLTGFDAPVLKKLYLTRVIKSHNLLQTLTRVNRPYKNFKYGYIVDFANIKDEFDETNRLYWEDLQNELGDEVENYSQLFKSSEEIKKELKGIEEFLFEFDLDNLEIFSWEIREIEDIDKVREIVKKLQNLKELYNLAKLYGYEKITQKLDIFKINKMLNETQNYLRLLIQKDALNKDASELLNIALEDVVFEFSKIKEEELKLADELKEVLRITREEFERNFDKNDIEFITLKEELQRIFKNKNIFEADSESIKENIPLLKDIYKKIKALNQANERLSKKYKNDKKFAKIHKNLKNKLTAKEIEIQKRLLALKEKADDMVLNREDILETEEYFKNEMKKYVVYEFKNFGLKPEDLVYISNLISKEYICEYMAC